VLGLFMDARPQAFLKKKKMNKLFGLFLHTLSKASVSHAEDRPSDVEALGEEAEMGSGGAKWGVEYYSLRGLEKTLTLDPAMAADRLAGGLWATCERLLSAEHAWVRTASARLLGLHFASWHSGSEKQSLAALSEAKPDSAYLAEPGRLFKLAKKHTWMLTAPPHLLPPALLLQLLKNLLFLSLSLHANPRLAVVAMKNEDEEEEDVKIKVETEPDEDIEGEEKMEEGGAEQEENGNPALHRLFRKIAYIARKPGNDERRGMALRWFAGMASRMGQEMKPYLVPTIGALFRITSSNDKAEEAIRNTASEVMELVTQSVGHSAYYSAYSQVRSHVTQTRLMRKRQRAVLAVVDPAAAARKKQRKHKSDAERYKRKAATHTVHKQSISIRSKRLRSEDD